MCNLNGSIKIQTPSLKNTLTLVNVCMLNIDVCFCFFLFPPEAMEVRTEEPALQSS